MGDHAMNPGRNGGRAVSLKEVAELAATSTATVSRVLSRSGAVSDALRQRVLNVVRETGYVPNVAASALAQRRTVKRGLTHRTVAFAISTVGGDAAQRNWDETCRGALQAAEELEINVTICLIDPRDLEEGHPPKALLRAPVDGILAGHAAMRGAQVLMRIAPTVLVGSSPPISVGAPVVEADHGEGIERLVAHLADLGHEKFEFLPWTLEHLPYRLRAEAFHRATTTRGLSGAVAPCVQDRIPEYVRNLLRRPRELRPTALVACSDGVAIQTMTALQAEGARIPEDFSVVGFDGRPWGRLSAPPLTSWRVHWQEMGRAALSVLMKLLERRSAPTRTLVGGELIARGSSGPLLTSSGAPAVLSSDKVLSGRETA